MIRRVRPQDTCYHLLLLYLWSSSGVLLISSENSKRGVLPVKSVANNLTGVRTGLSLVKFVVFKISGLAEVTLPLLG